MLQRFDKRLFTTVFVIVGIQC